MFSIFYFLVRLLLPVASYTLQVGWQACRLLMRVFELQEDLHFLLPIFQCLLSQQEFLTAFVRLIVVSLVRLMVWN